MSIGIVLAADSLKLSWDFRKNLEIYYSIHQTAQIQSGQYDQEYQHWFFTEPHEERSEGNCALVAQGDGTSIGFLIMKLQNIKAGRETIPQPEDQLLPQLAAKFHVGANGSIFDYEGGTAKETYLVLRLLFTLPEVALKEHEGRLVPMKLITDQQQNSALEGNISQHFQGFEVFKGISSAKFEYTIDLSESATISGVPGKTTWKGKGIHHYDIEKSAMIEAHWDLARKTETSNRETKVPVTITEIFRIDFAIDKGEMVKQIFDKLFLLHNEINKSK